MRQQAQSMSLFSATYMTNCSCKTTQLIVLLVLALLNGSCGQKGGLERPETVEIFGEEQLSQTSSSHTRD